jgi:hypothetical protein
MRVPRTRAHDAESLALPDEHLPRWLVSVGQVVGRDCHVNVRPSGAVVALDGVSVDGGVERR